MHNRRQVPLQILGVCIVSSLRSPLVPIAYGPSAPALSQPIARPKSCRPFASTTEKPSIAPVSVRVLLKQDDD